MPALGFGLFRRNFYPGCGDALYLPEQEPQIAQMIADSLSGFEQADQVKLDSGSDDPKAFWTDPRATRSRNRHDQRMHVKALQDTSQTLPSSASPW